MKTTNHGLGRTTIKQTVLDQLWAEAVRRQVMHEYVTPNGALLVWQPGSQQGRWVAA